MKETTKAFLYELADLLEKHNAEITASDEWTGYSECGQDLQISFEIKDDYEEIMLVQYIDFDKLRLRATEK